MPIRIPTVNRLQPQAPPSTPLINAPRVQPVLSDPSQTQKNLNLAKVIGRTEDNAASVKGFEFANEFENFWNKKVYGGDDEFGISRIQGDPTKAWETFDNDTVPSKITEIKEEYKNATPRAKAIIEQKLNETQARLQKKNILTRGNQYDKYRRETMDKAVELRSENVIDSFGVGIEEVENALGDLTRTIRSKATHQGTGSSKPRVVKSPDGELEVIQEFQHTTLSLREEQATVSMALSRGIRNSIASGVLDVAQEAIDKWGEALDGKDLTQIQKKLRDAQISEKAYEAVVSTRGMYQPRRLREIRKIKDPETQKEAMKQLNLDVGREKQIRDNTSDNAYRAVFSHAFTNLDKIKREGGIERDPVFRKQLDILKPHQIRGIKSLFKESETKSPEALKKMFEFYNEPDIASMTMEDLYRDYFPGLPKKEQTRMLRAWDRAKNPRGEEFNLKQITSKANSAYYRFFGGRKGRLSKRQKEQMADFVSSVSDIVYGAGIKKADDVIKTVGDFALGYRTAVRRNRRLTVSEYLDQIEDPLKDIMEKSKTVKPPVKTRVNQRPETVRSETPGTTSKEVTLDDLLDQPTLRNKI